jgi:hypothetical protein
MRPAPPPNHFCASKNTDEINLFVQREWRCGAWMDGWMDVVMCCVHWPWPHIKSRPGRQAPGKPLTAYQPYGTICHMKAMLLFEDRMTYPDGAILEMCIWKLPEPDTERQHGLKYRLFYGHANERIIGYDNERGKGDHRHYRAQEEPYIFSTVQKMMEDFLNDVDRKRTAI